MLPDILCLLVLFVVVSMCFSWRYTFMVLLVSLYFYYLQQLLFPTPSPRSSIPIIPHLTHSFTPPLSPPFQLPPLLQLLPLLELVLQPILLGPDRLWAYFGLHVDWELGDIRIMEIWDPGIGLFLIDPDTLISVLILIVLMADRSTIFVVIAIKAMQG